MSRSSPITRLPLLKDQIGQAYPVIYSSCRAKNSRSEKKQIIFLLGFLVCFQVLHYELNTRLPNAVLNRDFYCHFNKYYWTSMQMFRAIVLTGSQSFKLVLLMVSAFFFPEKCISRGLFHSVLLAGREVTLVSFFLYIPVNPSRSLAMTRPVFIDRDHPRALWVPSYLAGYAVY